MPYPILVYGATGGVGRALVARLAADGHRLHLSARGRTALDALAQEHDAAATAGDVGSNEDLRAITAAASADGGLAGLVFAVGSIDLMPLRRTTAEAFAGSFALNVTAAAQAVRHAQPALAAGHGAVVLFSSVAARLGFKNHVVIGTVKAAVEGLTRSLAAELAPKVRVNCIAPTLTRTPLAAPLLPNATVADALARLHPLGRLGEAADLAAVAAMLLGPGGAFMTGQVLHVDGGRADLSP